MSDIQFYGACDEVTGSKILISSNNSEILLDCGMFQGKKDESYLKNKKSDELQLSPDYCILSHAHIDHSGMLPSLVKRGYMGKIYSTPATMDLCKFMLKDSVEVFTKELPIIKKILKKKGIKDTVSPLYLKDDVDHCINQFFPVNYDVEFKLNSKLSFSFHDSCHILGSASIKLNITENNIKKRIWYSSDIGHNQQLLCDEPTIPQDIDYLIIETTYGNKKRVQSDIYQNTIDIIMDAYKRGGKVLIPAFSVGRMQTMILILHKLHILGLIPEMPIYIDSPLSINTTKIYDKYLCDIKDETIKFFTNKGIDPFNDSMIHYVDSPEETQRLLTTTTPCIILSSSGMMEGGRVREYAKYITEDSKSTIMFVGFNAVDTLGRRIEEHNGTVKIDGEEYRVRCKVEKIDGLSAHADLDSLINYIENTISSNAIKQIFLIHGDPESIKNVNRILIEKGITNVVIPKIGETYKL